MIVCPVCGFRNMDANDRCFKCSALLKRDEELVRKSARLITRRSRGDRWKRFALSPIDYLRHKPWVQRIVAIPEDGPYKFPFTAGLLSVVPGAGHWYAGQPVKGILLFIAGAALVTVAVVGIREPWSNWVLFTLLGYGLLVWADSVASAARSNGDSWSLRKTLALVCAAMMLMGVSITVMQWLGVNVLTFQKVSATTMAPALLKGDRVLFTDLPLWIRAPRVGEVVQFDPPRFTANQGKNLYSINISKYFQRVIGAPGDRLVKKGVAFYRNGKVLGMDEVPFAGERLPDFDLVVPDGRYFIPVTGIPSDSLAALFGAGSISYVGEPGFIFDTWPALAFIEEDAILAKGLAVINPPERRKWLK